MASSPKPPPITDPPGVTAELDQQTQPARTLARIYAAFYTTLRENGIPKALAGELTAGFAESPTPDEDE